VANQKHDEEGRIYLSESILKWNPTFDQELKQSEQNKMTDELWWITPSTPSIGETVVLHPGIEQSSYQVIANGDSISNKSHTKRKTSYVLLRRKLESLKKLSYCPQ